MKRYDFIIAGGGAAGLSLACHLINSPLRDRSILVVDKDAKDQNDRTWAFWTDRPTLFDGIVHRTWSQLQIRGECFERTLGLRTYRYKVIRGIDFYRFAHEALAGRANVELLRGRIDRIEDGDQQAGVVVDGHMYAGRWVFNSLLDWSACKPARDGYHCLVQQFEGWEIETPASAFDPEVPILLDFRTPQHGEMRFFYVLPFSDRHALVESVLCTAARSTWETYEQALRDYLATSLRIKEYGVCRTERGFSPLTDRPFPRRTGRNIMTIGNQGGRIKPSTGYAFLRIQRDSAAIVRSLLAGGHPFRVPPSPLRYRFFDSVMLHILDEHGERIRPILTSLFTRNPADRVFRFLDEMASPWEDLLMIPSLPPRLLWQTMLQAGTLRRV